MKMILLTAAILGATELPMPVAAKDEVCDQTGAQVLFHGALEVESADLDKASPALRKIYASRPAMMLDGAYPDQSVGMVRMLRVNYFDSKLEIGVYVPESGKLGWLEVKSDCKKPAPSGWEKLRDEFVEQIALVRAGTV
ncbi:MAG: hypothetical protein H6920_09060 [Sphingomonadaceae bacterium]|nr:hypothetical protein [Sphingomonadaceae bacterium]MCP5384033.1 hypothetical protein [Altererythrobacter sp.]MCP5391755.1 hypothetical protein [Sphingomonadaceae bacterium]MCP5393085.1 hypothetical protein [Sphingomonadaceae bacterium]